MHYITVEWFVDRVLPGVLISQLVLSLAYIRLYFERRWPFWGRTGKGRER